ncbi:hypothetical protein BO71DRAFT_413575 [Aspergillus ellipticus CBS 707.79]|uniref:Uncharacterized protein n=1 Tax=Aspergillus ellipticus CBS 707.79 TaxID=1448320 RepID=A0A319CVN4_9EURO|nr:hypothetical protein BO71DRAFT_413575 [Aspergillus ellipticus CBS 707.79]
MVFSQTLRRAAAQASPYRSPFAPKYTVPAHFHGVTAGTATKYGQIAGAFGVAAGTFALFFFGEIPRVRRDILQKVPFLDQYFDRTIAPEDNVTLLNGCRMGYAFPAISKTRASVDMFLVSWVVKEKSGV